MEQWGAKVTFYSFSVVGYLFGFYQKMAIYLFGFCQKLAIYLFGFCLSSIFCIFVSDIIILLNAHSAG